MVSVALDLLGDFAAALGLDGDDLRGQVQIGVREPLASTLATTALLTGAVAAASASALRLAAARSDRQVAPVARIDPRRVAAACSSDGLRLDGVAPDPWAELSGVWPTADGWLRTLARTARWLQQAPRPEGAVPAPLDPGRWMSGHDTPLGRLVTAGPAVRFDGGPRASPVWGGPGEPIHRSEAPRRTNFRGGSRRGVRSRCR